ncbi:hypothetical protein B0H67DRAFT_586551 [Lasiosphaeris hirsuta]|uniref:Uncharacterized protein n=1 Tax=Lasiosphaeris hirsuta TaxID=260670 RepID=A0AA40A9T1_9PEZI|nr:hypothetical protein B0H67DRAFT_586551 [Lasiosphaeris hirsuta]
MAEEAYEMQAFGQPERNSSLLSAIGNFFERVQIVENEIHGLVADLDRIANLHGCVLGRQEVDVSLYQALDQAVSASWQKHTTIASQIYGLKADAESMGGDSNSAVKKDLVESLVVEFKKTVLQALEEEKAYKASCRDGMARQYWTANRDAHGIADRKWDDELCFQTAVSFLSSCLCRTKTASHQRQLERPRIASFESGTASLLRVAKGCTLNRRAGKACP